jgi:hypothetical protein
VVEKRGVRHHRANNSRPPGLCILNLYQRLYSKVSPVSVKTVDRTVGECNRESQSDNIPQNGGILYSGYTNEPDRAR